VYSVKLLGKGVTVDCTCFCSFENKDLPSIAINVFPTRGIHQVRTMAERAEQVFEECVGFRPLKHFGHCLDKKLSVNSFRVHIEQLVSYLPLHDCADDFCWIHIGRLSGHLGNLEKPERCSFSSSNNSWAAVARMQPAMYARKSHLRNCPLDFTRSSITGERSLSAQFLKIVTVPRIARKTLTTFLIVDYSNTSGAMDDVKI